MNAGTRRHGHGRPFSRSTEVDNPDADVGARLRDLRRLAGLSQRELGRRTGLSNSFLSEVENGRRGLGAASLLRLCRALGASMDYVMTGEEYHA